jgi:small-conductance mechanosensitive channel
VNRLWRSGNVIRFAIPLLCILALGILDQQRDRIVIGNWSSHGRDSVHYGLVLLAAAIAVYAVRIFTQAVGKKLREYLGLARARSATTLLSFVLYCLIFLLAVTAAGFDISGFLVGGALTGVIIGIAGQTSLSNLIAGLVILFVRPYTAGMDVTVRTGSFGGTEYSGRVWDVSLFYTTLHSADQEIRIPNSSMVVAVVVVRPLELDVYVPVSFPLNTPDIEGRIADLHTAVQGHGTDQLLPQVTLERVTEVGYVVGVRVSVAGMQERLAVERAIIAVVADSAGAPPGASPPADREAEGSAP